MAMEIERGHDWGQAVGMLVFSCRLLVGKQMAKLVVYDYQYVLLNRCIVCCHSMRS